MLNQRIRNTAGTAVLAAAILCAGIGAANNAHAGTLENLERERAMVIETILNPELSANDRFAKITSSKSRLIDLERMVLRDNSLKGRNTPTVRKAFNNYDLTFMVHAAAEKNVSLIDLWLEQLGLTSQSVMSASVRRR